MRRMSSAYEECSSQLWTHPSPFACFSADNESRMSNLVRKSRSADCICRSIAAVSDSGSMCACRSASVHKSGLETLVARGVTEELYRATARSVSGAIGIATSPAAGGGPDRPGVAEDSPATWSWTSLRWPGRQSPAPGRTPSPPAATASGAVRPAPLLCAPAT